MDRVLTSGAVLSIAAIAAGQTSPYTIEIHVDPPVIEPGESATIELRAAFDSDRDWAMSGVLTSLLCSTGSEFLAGEQLVAPMNGPGTTVGSDTIAGFEGIIAGQIQTHDIYADPTVPIPFWRVRYLAGPVSSGGEEVVFETRTARYQVYLSRGSSWAESRMLEFIDGQAVLRVVACRADFNGDGVADLFDFLAFMNAFDAGDPLADFDFDGELTVFDFLAFQNRFDQGCS